MTERVFFSIDRHERGGLQLSIDHEDGKGGGSGFRLQGPKYTGGSTRVMTYVPDMSDIAEIRDYLNKAARIHRRAGRK